MLYVLTHNILPVFSILALGFILGRTQLVSKAEATTLNRIAFLILQPPLIFPLINGVDFENFSFSGIAFYGMGQAVIFSATFMTCRFILKHEIVESWLLAMATIFVNSVLYIWPITNLIYGEGANIPIAAIVAWDASITFAFFIVSTDLLANKTSSVSASLKRVATNPILIVIVLGITMNLLHIPTPAPVLTGLKFVGAAAAPLTLFALGVILSGHSLAPSKTIIVVSSLKLFGLPLLVGALLTLGALETQWNQMLLLNAAGPAGAMAFALAVLHNVRTDRIAPIIIWTSVLSLFSLAWLA
ncbi:AEC family transporter [Alphaproteobacteria bacterium]|nr:AEC family transporter [Alphaproteobacteria bacterium]